LGIEEAIRAFFIGVGGAAVFWLIKRATELLGAYKRLKIRELEFELDKIKERDSKSGLDELIDRENSSSDSEAPKG